MPKELIRRIPVKRLRSGFDPDDQVVYALRSWTPERLEQKPGSNPESFLYETFVDGMRLELERMEDMEGKFGPESVFEDRIGTCYVAATAFDLRREPEIPMENHRA